MSSLRALQLAPDVESSYRLKTLETKQSVMETVISIDAVQRNFRLLELTPDILSSLLSQVGPG